MKERILREYAYNKTLIADFFCQRGNSKVSATTDLWTSPNHHAVMAVTVSLIDANWELREVVLAFKKIKGSHSGLNIAASFWDIIKEYSIESQVT